MSDEFSGEALLGLYEVMLRIRGFEERAVELFKNGELPGFIHPSVGQEAVPAGVCSVLRVDDLITSTHRGHGHLIAKGAPLAGMFAELMGLEGGLCHGRGGSMHIMDASVGILGANGIVGGGLAIAVGAALGLRQQGRSGVVVCFFGDGAVNTGSFHEAVNLAAIWSLPVLFVCENNQYAESTPVGSVLPIPDLRPRAASYGIPGAVVDGNDVTAIASAASEGVDRARAGLGPTLIEASTYRWYGHHTGDVAPYRTSEEVAAWKARDPILRTETALAKRGPRIRRRMEDMQRNVTKEIEASLDEARQSAPPDVATLERDVLATSAKSVLR